MLMAANSIAMLRRFNKDVPITVLLIEQHEIAGAEFGCYLAADEFLRICDQHSVAIVRKKNLAIDYFQVNKSHVFEMQSPLLFLDVDTFIFGDVAQILERYKTDIAACQNLWAVNRGINGGVLLLNNNWQLGKGIMWREEIASLDCQIGHVRDELALSNLVVKTGATLEFFEKSHVHIPLWPQELEECRNSIVFHSYAQNWKAVFNSLRRTRMKMGRRICW